MLKQHVAMADAGMKEKVSNLKLNNVYTKHLTSEAAYLKAVQIEGETMVAE